MGKSARARCVLGLSVALCAGAGCSDGASNSAATTLPLLTPPVRAATPPALGGTGVRPASSAVSGVQRKLFALDTADLKSRFFTAGPTSIFKILGDVDGLIEEINRSARKNEGACLTQEPVPYSLTPWGQSLTFYAQCFRSLASASPQSSFFQFGQKDGVVYLYVATGAEHVAARITPVGVAAPDGGIVPGKYSVDAWIGVGYNNATSCGPMTGFDSCSYGVIELHTDETRLGLELTVAGIGFGYCGARLKSDGAHVFAIGSPDMGESCVVASTLCVAASDVTTPEVCDPQLSMFSTPALGRLAASGSNGSMGPSQYPGRTDNQIVLNGTPTDSLGFGPSAPAPGAGELSAGPTKQLQQ